MIGLYVYSVPSNKKKKTRENKKKSKDKVKNFKINKVKAFYTEY